MRISHGPYDPRQGDFAIAGTSTWSSGSINRASSQKGPSAPSARARRHGVRPHDRDWHDSFAAFEAYSTDGPGTGTRGDRALFVGQLAYTGGDH